jgi:hypothetical protein
MFLGKNWGGPRSLFAIRKMPWGLSDISTAGAEAGLGTAVGGAAEPEDDPEDDPWPELEDGWEEEEEADEGWLEEGAAVAAGSWAAGWLGESLAASGAAEPQATATSKSKVTIVSRIARGFLNQYNAMMLSPSLFCC